MLTDEQRNRILTLAREAIAEFLLNHREIDPPVDDYLCVSCGVFVTLKNGKELRGCIGFPEAKYPLGRAIIKAAIYAATDDPRFYGVSANELPQVEIDISVLSPVRQISDISEIIVGEHGLILTLGHFRGLLLPQVPIEHQWDLDLYLKNICRKAGLWEGAWKDERAKLEVFTAEVFGED